MKKLLSVAVVVVMILVLSTSVMAETSENAYADVYVTVVNKGELVAVQEKVTVKDHDMDGFLTVNDALYSAHEAKYEGGASAGYSTYTSDYGLSLGTLWGDTSGSFGYYLNNASCMGLTDLVKTGDYVTAFVYSDSVAWSDAYCYFDVNTAECKEGDEITLTLRSAGYDENWAPVELAVEGATVTLDGVATEYKTDADGKVTVKLDKSGKVIISATSDTQTIVPPVCLASVEANEANVSDTAPDTASDTTENDGGCASTIGASGAVLIALPCIFGLALNRKKNEK